MPKTSFPIEDALKRAAERGEPPAEDSWPVKKMTNLPPSFTSASPLLSECRSVWLIC